MLILRVGDPHVKISNIEESEKLFEFVAEQAIANKVNRIEILGDLFHTHAVLRLEVVDFWVYALEHLSEICEVVVLVGNHDQSGDHGSSISALDVFMKMKNKNLHIVNLPRVMGSIGYMPYIHDSNKFIELSNHLAENFGAKTLVCHQTFSGSKYENGFYAPDGVDPDKINVNLIISGHIHAQQRFGKVIYPGTARWDSISDANQPKGVWIFDHNPDGSIANETFFSTEKICQPILSYEFVEGGPEPTWPDNARVAVELIGSSDWVSKQKDLYKGKCSIKTKITDKVKLLNRKMGKSFEDFINNYLSSSPKEKLINFMRKRKLV